MINPSINIAICVFLHSVSSRSFKAYVFEKLVYEKNSLLQNDKAKKISMYNVTQRILKNKSPSILTYVTIQIHTVKYTYINVVKSMKNVWILRFHSCVVLVEIWKNTYRTRESL